MSDTPFKAWTERDGALLRLRLARPKANLVDAEMIRALHGALVEFHKHPGSLRGALLDAEGPHFSFGASVAEHRKEQAKAMLESFHALFHRLAALSVPTAAIVRGQCLGGGLELASFCTWIFAAPDARFGQPEIQLGVFPPMASIVLPWRIGGGAALALCVGGASIDASEAARIGLVTRVADDPRASFDALYAEQLAGKSASSLRFGERAARAGLYEQLARRLPRLESMYLAELMETRDANEGIAAFLERRVPDFCHG